MDAIVSFPAELPSVPSILPLRVTSFPVALLVILISSRADKVPNVISPETTVPPSGSVTSLAVISIPAPSEEISVSVIFPPFDVIYISPVERSFPPV